MIILIALRESLSESHPATPEAVGLIRHAVADYAHAIGMNGRALDDVRVAVSEAVTNVVLHAYRTEHGEVHVIAREVGDELWVLVTDDGSGPNAPSFHPGLGWGLAIITEACDQFTLVERGEGGTEARMCFRIRSHSDLTPAGR